MHTKDKLADALRKVGLTDMAAKAETGYYHDFLSSLDMPELQLEADLRQARDVADALGKQDTRESIEAVRQRHLNGDFDASAAESEEWAAGPDGQEAMRRLITGSL